MTKLWECYVLTKTMGMGHETKGVEEGGGIADPTSACHD